MKILLSSDHHYWNYTEFSTGTVDGMTSRFRDMLIVEDWLFSYMKDHGIYDHIRCGDLFDRKNILDAVVYREVSQKILRNNKYGITEFILGGNHDVAGGGTRWTIENLAATTTNNRVIVKVITSIEQIVFDGWTFIFAPYHPDNCYLPSEQITTAPSVLISHIEVTGAQASTEYKLRNCISVDEMHPEWYTHMFSGHIHLPQRVGELEYIGSLMQRNFSDAGPARRVIVFDTQTGAWESVYVPGPKFARVSITSLDGLPPPEAGTYYLIVRESNDVSGDEVLKWGEGKCAGVKLPPYSKPKKPRLPYNQGGAPIKLEDLLRVWLQGTPMPDGVSEEELINLGVKYFNA